MPRVSVIMPSYNHAEFVGQAIESVLSQSFRDLELIVADDGSIDGTPDVVRGFADPRIDLTVFPENRGACEAGNFCIGRARGEYLALINSDDFFLPGKLARQVAYLDANPGTAAVFGLASFVGGDGGAVPPEDNPFHFAFFTDPADRFAWLRHFFLGGNALCHSTVMIRRSVLEELGPYDVTLRQLPDLDMWVRVCARHPIHVMAEPLTGYRVLGGFRNASAPSPPAIRRSVWEHVRIRRHYRAMDADTLQRAFGQDIPAPIAASGLPMPLQLALMAAERRDAQLAVFALETLEDAVLRGVPGIGPKDLHRLTGALDPFNNDAVMAMQRQDAGPQVRPEDGPAPDAHVPSAHAPDAHAPSTDASSAETPDDARTGYLDVCLQSHCAGWAVENGEPAQIEILLNGGRIATLRCDVERPDLAAIGLPRRAGFHVAFPAALSADDVVGVRFMDGKDIPNSPNNGQRERLKQLLHGIAPGHRGLEIGALDRPTVTKDHYDVSYVDHATRGDLIQKYQRTGGASFRSDLIVETDIVWNSTRLMEAAGGGYQYCLASHVIEHIADPIGWLGQIAEVLVPGGRLNLAVPEKTLTFDHLRALTRPAQILDSWARKLTRPAFGQIFDHVSAVWPIDASGPPGPPRVQEAFAVAKAFEASEDYADVHCHVWTHDSFLECWSVIDQLGLLPFALDSSYPALPGANEFIVSLVKKDATPAVPAP